jgi:hypothetical protein
MAASTIASKPTPQPITATVLQDVQADGIVGISEAEQRGVVEPRSGKRGDQAAHRLAVWI